MSAFKNQKQRFSIKKYHFGAASVLLGVVFFVSTTNDVSADEIDKDTSFMEVKTNTPIGAATSLEGVDMPTNSNEVEENPGIVGEVSNISPNETIEDRENNTVQIKERTVTTSDFEELSPQTIKQLQAEDFRYFEMTPDLYKKLSRDQINALTLNKHYQVASKTVPHVLRAAKENIENRDGYSVNENNLPEKSNLPYAINKTPNPDHYTFEVVMKGDDGAKQYVLSVRKEDIDQEGTPMRFFITTFDDSRRSSLTTVDIKNVQDGDQIKIDDQTLIGVIASGDKRQFRFLKVNDADFSDYTPIYGPNIDKYTNPVVSYPITLPFWKGQTTHYYDELGGEIVPSYTQYGWTRSQYTTEPIDIEGYDINTTKMPINKNGFINRYSTKISGNVRYSVSTMSRGTLYRKDTVIDDEGTIKTEAWFTYAKGPGTFDSINGAKLDKGRIEANNLPNSDYDFELNPNNYSIRDTIIDNVEEEKYFNHGFGGQVIFQKVRFIKDGLPSNDAISVADYDGGDAASSSSVTLKKGEVTNSRYDNGRTLDISNRFEYPDTVEYYYTTQEGNLIVNYVDELGNTIKEAVEDTPNTKFNTPYDTVVDNRPQEIVFGDKVYELVPSGEYPVGTVSNQGNLTISKMRDIYASSDLNGGDPIGNITKGTKYVTYVYKEKIEEPGKYIPYIPADPTDPTNPNDPLNPTDPNTGNPI
ncbi:YSIRK-type signal peptide-containing protein, partial [Staphylococcus succinus]